MEHCTQRIYALKVDHTAIVFCQQKRLKDIDSLSSFSFISFQLYDCNDGTNNTDNRTIFIFWNVLIYHLMFY